MWCIAAVFFAYLSKGVADFFSRLAVEDSSTLDNLAVTWPPPTQSPPVDSTGFFDGITIESAFTESLDLSEAPTTNPAFGVESSTPSSLGKREDTPPQIRSEPTPSDAQQNYDGIISAMVVITGIILMVGLLQLLMLTKIARGLSHCQQAMDVGEGYTLSRGKNNDAEVARGS